MMKPNPDKNAQPWGSQALWNRIAWISGIFALLVCVLLIANYIQYKKSDPVNMPVLNSLVERLYENPSDAALREQIRTLELLSRKAYFTSQWQIRTGGLLVMAALALMIIALQIVEYRKKLNPAVVPAEGDERMLQQKKARRWIVLSGGFILILAITFAFLSNRDLETGLHSRLSPVAEKQAPANQDTLTPEALPARDTLSAVAAADTVSAKTISRDNFPNFRGKGGYGVSEKTQIPVHWDGATGKNILWKTAIPLPGYSSPILWGDKVFVTGASDSRQEVYCLDRNQGRILWTYQVKTGNSDKPKVSAETGFSAPTPVTDEKGVYAIFPTGNIVALDQDGKKIWERNLGLPKNHYGHASSLLLYNDRILVQYDQTGGARIMALSVADGRTLWSTDRPVKVSWSSPILVNTGKRMELILVADPYVASYNPATGAELWKIDCISGEVGPSLAYANGIVYAVNEYAKLCAVKIGDTPSILWENTDYMSDIPSPVANKNFLFLPTSYGTFLCYDAQSGQKYWEKDFGTAIFSSPMLVDGKVYVLDRSGVMHIFKPDKEYKLLAEPRLGEKSACTPAFTNGRIYIRGEKNLYCIGA